jgi:hypothetical protein
MDVVALVLAFLAFVLSIWNSWETRRHNRLTVSPHLWFNLILGWNEDLVGINLANNGVGPAIIKNISYYIDNNKVDPSPSLTKVMEKAVNILDHDWIIWSSNSTGTTIPSGEKTWLVAARCNITPAEYRNSFIKALSRLKILVEYESIYNEPKKTSINISESFGPNSGLLPK